MHILVWVLGALLGLVVLVTLIGMVLPRDHVTTSEITLKAPPEEVYARLRDIGGMTTWWTDLKVCARVDGVPGERWQQEAGGFKMKVDVVDDVPPKRFTTRIVNEGAPFGGEWVHEFTPAGTGTT
ncbi:MAG TPA: SRPBCC family protein, partial [Gemmatimonadaceae bacterium]|nr:SRPBCC family protein [Gemmatimonadaceae bacterium]